MWGYFENGKCIATNLNDMKGNTGWEKVPENTVPDQVEEPIAEIPTTLEQRVAAVEAVVNGTPTYVELLEAVHVLMEG